MEMQKTWGLQIIYGFWTSCHVFCLFRNSLAPWTTNREWLSTNQPFPSSWAQYKCNSNYWKSCLSWTHQACQGWLPFYPGWIWSRPVLHLFPRSCSLQFLVCKLLLVDSSAKIRGGDMYQVGLMATWLSNGPHHWALPYISAHVKISVLDKLNLKNCNES